MTKLFNFKTSYTQLPPIFYQYVKPTAVAAPKLLVYNAKLAARLAVLEGAEKAEIAQILSGNKLLDDSRPLAQAYCGHQFGYFTMLGDGRAVLLGEHIAPTGERFDIQLKGCGKTAYSRGGDGRANVAPMLREYLISEAMHALGIKTTRSLAVVATGEKVRREKLLDGAVLTRLASSHLRVGTFQYAARQADKRHLKALADYAINRHYPEYSGDYRGFYKAVVMRQIELVTDWMRVGFVHGVMNTDNVSITGETIDYGPCAFMDSYNAKTVFSSIDMQGRYAYGNQPAITIWNMARLAEALLPLLGENPQATAQELEAELNEYRALYHKRWLAMMGRKLGFESACAADGALIHRLLSILKDGKYDYTNTFIYLRARLKPLSLDAAKLLPEAAPNKAAFDDFCNRWLERLADSRQSVARTLKIMEAANPMLIARNHLVEAALQNAEAGDMSDFNKLLSVLAKPYDYDFDDLAYILPLRGAKPYVTYCGT